MLPTLSWYVPGEHATQSKLLWLAEYVPALQGRGRSAPVLHAWPVGQTWHCAGFSKPVAFEKVPGLHGKGAEERLAQ